MNRSILTVPVRKIDGQSSTEPVQDLLAVEEPLEIKLNGRTVSITMRTPGHDYELAAGFLFTEGILASASQVERIAFLSPNTVQVELAAGNEPDLDRLQRNFYTTSSCGVCGKASIEAIHAQGCSILSSESPLITTQVIHRLPASLRGEQSVFDRTGGLHAAALFDPSGQLHILREDIGRHNAVDKLIGAQFLENCTPLDDRLMLVSGRASFELVQKAVMAGIPILAAVGAPSSLAVETARRFNMTLLGFVRDGRFNIYSGAARIQ